MVCLNNSWDLILKDEFHSEYYQNLRQFLKKEYFTRTIYPPMDDIFNAFKYIQYASITQKIIKNTIRNILLLDSIFFPNNLMNPPIL